MEFFKTICTETCSQGEFLRETVEINPGTWNIFARNFKFQFR